MYKIKDNVDLKELEKYGYRKDAYGMYLKTSIFCGERVEVFVQENNTFFIQWGYYLMSGEEQERFLQDLIDEGLVEKVKEELNEDTPKIPEKINFDMPSQWELESKSDWRLNRLMYKANEIIDYLESVKK